MEWNTGLDAVQRDVLVERLQTLTIMMGRLERASNRVAGQHTGVQLLKTIPGVGTRTAEAVLAWVDEPRRFHQVRP